jgi:hypothetical protein
MITVNLVDKKIPFPENLSIEQYKKIVKYDFSNVDEWRAIICSCLNVDENEMDNADDELIIILIGYVVALIEKRTEVKLNNFNDFTFGEFIDLEVYLSLGFFYHHEEMTKILATEQTNDAHAIMFVIEKYIEWRTFIYRQYNQLFSVEDVDENLINEINNNKMATAKSWYSTIVKIANEDITKIKEIEEMNFKQVLNFMAYKKEQRLILEAEQRKNNRKR